MGHLAPVKTCTLCRRSKPATLKYFARSRKIHLTARCRKCLGDFGKAQYQKKKESRLERARLVRYGLTQAQIQAMGDRCPICGVLFTTLTRKPHVDHCHTTGIVRGILCTNCNTGLGLFKDNPIFLTKALKYLVAFLLLLKR